MTFQASTPGPSCCVLESLQDLSLPALQLKSAKSSTRSALAVSRGFGGFLHLDAAGLLHPAIDHGIHLVSDGRGGPSANSLPL